MEEIDFSKEILLYGATFSNLKESFSEQLSFKNINKINKNSKIVELQDKIKKMEKKNITNLNRDSKS